MGNDMKIDVDLEVLASYHGNLLAFGRSSEYYCEGILRALGPFMQSGNDSVYDSIEDSVKAVVHSINKIDQEIMALAEQIKKYYDFVIVLRAKAKEGRR